MIEHIPADLASISIYGATALVVSASIIRWARRMFYTEKKDTSDDIKNTTINAAEASLYDILSKENERMADQMIAMSLQLTSMATQINNLVNENLKLSLTISELTISVKSLARVETENVELLRKIAQKDDRILKLTQDLADMFARFSPNIVSSKIE